MEKRFRLRMDALEKNGDYEQQLKEWEEQQRYGNNFHNDGRHQGPRDFVDVPYLDVILTEKEWEAVKKAIIGVK